MDAREQLRDLELLFGEWSDEVIPEAVDFGGPPRMEEGEPELPKELRLTLLLPGGPRVTVRLKANATSARLRRQQESGDCHVRTVEYVLGRACKFQEKELPSLEEFARRLFFEMWKGLSPVPLPSDEWRSWSLHTRGED